MGGLYDFVVRAKGSACSGSVKSNGTVLHAAQTFGGVILTLPAAVPTALTSFETVLTRTGSPDTRIWTFDSQNRVVGFDDDGGIGLASRVTNDKTRSILLSAFNDLNVGYTDFYVNPMNGAAIVDVDFDGLGDALEAELGTCTTLPCGNAVDPTDTDRDGIEDAAEVFGVDDVNYPQFLPKWGANPRHKDVFVEWDWDPAYGSTRFFTGADAQAAYLLMSGGSANDLLNPDNVAGINFHFDIGVANTSNTLFGDWGGSNMDTLPSPLPGGGVIHENPANFNPIRKGIFRHAFMSSGPNGGSDQPSSWLWWPGSPADRNTITFAHELGHSLGLQHWGHNSWGRGDCKPTYTSVMSYLFMGMSGFSTGTYKNIILNGAGSFENSPFGTGGVPSYFRPRLSYQVDGSNSHVDWNRDIRTEMTPGVKVRSPIRWAPGGDCDTFSLDGVSMVPEQNAQLNYETPALIKYNGRMYMFYATTRGLVYKSTPVGGIDVDGSCGGSNCTTWSAETVIPTANPSVLGVAAWVHGITLMVVYRTNQGLVYINMSNGASPAGVISPWWYTGLIGPMDATPSITSMYVDPAIYVVSDLPVIFGSVDGAYKRWTGYVNGMTTVDYVTDSTGHHLNGITSPTVIPWPSRGGVSHASNGTNCAVFVDQGTTVRFYCYERATDRWRQHTDFIFSNYPIPKTRTKVGLAYHVLRDGNAAPLANDVARGQFWMTVADADKNGDGVLDPLTPLNPDLYVSGAMTNSEPPAGNNNQMKFWTKGPYLELGLISQILTTVGLYEDESISAMKGVVVMNTRDHMFLPHADGTLNENLRDGNDYQIIERAICKGVREDWAETICGGLNVHGY
jgi:hypothetical protein